VKELEKRLEKLAAEEYPVAKRPEEEVPGVGPLTSLAVSGAGAEARSIWGSEQAAAHQQSGQQAAEAVIDQLRAL